MANTYTSLYYHFTFSTKNRETGSNLKLKQIQNQREHHRKKIFQEEMAKARMEKPPEGG